MAVLHELDFLVFLEPLEGIGEGFDWVGDGGGDVGGIDGLAGGVLSALRNVLIAFALVQHGIRFLGSVQDEVDGLAANLTRRVEDVGSTASIRTVAPHVRCTGIVEAIDADLCEFRTIEALVPEDDEVGSFIVETQAFELLRGVTIPHFLLFGSETNLDGFTVRVGDGKFELAVLRRRKERAGSEEEYRHEKFTQGGGSQVWKLIL